MSEKKELNNESLKQVAGGTNDDIYTRGCTNCHKPFDIRTVEYKIGEEQDIGGDGHPGSYKNIYYKCPHCNEFTLTETYIPNNQQ